MGLTLVEKIAARSQRREQNNICPEVEGTNAPRANDQNHVQRADAQSANEWRLFFHSSQLFRARLQAERQRCPRASLGPRLRGLSAA